MQMSVDGFVAGPNGELDWMMWDQDEKLLGKINELTDSSDTILLGRKMTDEFVNYWTNVLTNPRSPEYSFAKKMVDIPKVVFTKTLDTSSWANTVLAKGDISDEVRRLKEADGKDIVVYGGAGFVTSLVKEDLIDDYYLFVNPTAIGKGMTIFGSVGTNRRLKLADATEYECGIVVNHYQKG
jgi:dihydrofolate reductase